MEIGLMPFGFSIFLILILILVNYIKAGKKQRNLNLPPSPPKLPVIGHLHHLMGGEVTHRTLRRLSQKYGDVMHLQLGSVTTVIISSSQAAKEVLKDQDPACADRPHSIGTSILWYNHADIVFSPYNEFWRQMRKLCIVELLSAKNVRSFASIRRDEASRLVDSIKSYAGTGKAVNVTEKIFDFTCSITCRAAFGEEIRNREIIVAATKAAVATASGFELADFFPSSCFLSLNKYKLLRIRRKLDSNLRVILDEHRLKRRGEFGGEDMIDVLLRVQKSGELNFPITDDNIKSIFLDLFGAGSETSSTAMDWAMAELMKNPRVMKKAQAEVRQALKGKETVEESDVQTLKYLKMVIKETLRLHPPFVLNLRACRQECKADGYTIPLKAKVFVNVWAMGRDPRYWDDPESFKPERFENNSIDFLGNNFEFIPFGAGKRMCPGINFGIANVDLPLAQMLYHFDWEVPKGMNCDDIDMTEQEGLSVARKHPLILVPKVYNSTPMQ